MDPALFALIIQQILALFLGISLDALVSEFVTPDSDADDMPNGEIHDFIIVGGGSAGSVMASRLSETTASVLLIEAGGHPHPLTYVPGLAPAMLNNPDLDWVSPIVPQKIGCQALLNKGIVWNRGKMLGGCSSLNYMIYMRGNPNDYDNWAYETSDRSWRYEKLLPYFKKMENYHGYFSGDNFYHSTGGPLDVNKQPYGPLQDEYIRAGQEMGLKVKDPNGYQTESVYPFDTTTKDGTRFSTYRAYLEPALNRSNLKISLYSQVTKVHFIGKRAVGVSYVKNGILHFVRARKEVILSAGTLGSPQILMLSGIGPARHLRSQRIRVIQDLPVGQSLQDHVFTVVGPFKTKSGTLTPLGPEALQEYSSGGRGPLSVVGVPAGAHIASSFRPRNWPDIYLSQFLYAVNEPSVLALEKAYNFQPGIIQKFLNRDYGSDAFFIICTLVRPYTRGELRLRSADPFDKVVIDPKYFRDPRDLQILVEGAKLSVALGSKTKAFQDIGINYTTALFPGCEHLAPMSDDYWRCHATHWTQTEWHFSSTCRMGRARGDRRAVVDSKLRVIGIKELRVIDNSIMPWVTNANTNAPAIVIAEKMADVVKKYHRLAASSPIN